MIDDPTWTMLTVAPVEVVMGACPVIVIVACMDDAEAKSKNAALLRAVRQSDVDAMRRAIAAGAEVNQHLPDERGCPTLLCGTIPKLSRASVEVLLKAGAHVNARDGLGFTALTRLALFPLGVDDVEGIVGDLIRAGADVHARTKNGVGALDYAVQNAVGELELSRGLSRTELPRDPKVMVRVVDALLSAGTRTEMASTFELLRRMRRLDQSREV
jgi:hypothetical protein